MSDDVKKLLAVRNSEAAAPAEAPQARMPKAAAAHIPLMLGTVEIPIHLETRHLLAAGTTGSGKSQQIYQLLSAVRKREQPAIIIDHSAEFLQRYYDPDRDYIFNPMDTRSIGWTVFNELRFTYDFDGLSRALIPDIEGPNQDWQMGAQQLLSNIMRCLFHMGKPFRTNEALLYFVTSAPIHSAVSDQAGAQAEVKEVLAELAAVDLADTARAAALQQRMRDLLANARTENQASLQYLLRDTTSKRLFEPGTEKTLGITLQILSRYMQPLTYLKEGDFSITEFVQRFENPGACKSYLFLSYTDASYAAVRSLFSVIVSCGILAALRLSENALRRFFFVLDEFASLEKISAISDATTKLRKRGGVFVCGIQSFAQLVEKYGQVGAQILLSCFGNLLMLRTADNETADKMSLLCGEIEKPQESETVGISISTSRDGGSDGHSQSTTTQLVTKRRLIPAEFYKLDDLNGIVRIAGDNSHEIREVARTLIPVSKLPIIAPAELTRPDVLLDLN